MEGECDVCECGVVCVVFAVSVYVVCYGVCVVRVSCVCGVCCDMYLRDVCVV